MSSTIAPLRVAFARTAFAASLALTAACTADEPRFTASDDGLDRAIVDELRATVYQVRGADGLTWYEIQIALHQDRTFRMPIVFLDGQRRFTELPPDAARNTIHDWVKARAENLAATGSLVSSLSPEQPVLLLVAP